MQEAAEAVAPDQVSVWAAASLVVEARARVARVPAEARVVAEVRAAPAVQEGAAVPRLMPEICGARHQGRAVAEPVEECQESVVVGQGAAAAEPVTEVQVVGLEVAQEEAAELAGQAAATEVQEVALEGAAQEAAAELAAPAPEVQEVALEEAPGDLRVELRVLAAWKAQRLGNGSPRQHCCELGRQRVALAVP
jgi:hypothetical protein